MDETPEQRLGLLVRAYLRRERRRDRTPDDLLTQQRAAAVLALIHGWSPWQLAPVLGVDQPTAATLVPTDPGWADALRARAERAEQESRPPAARHAAGPPRHRSWRLPVAVALAVSVALTGWQLTRPRAPLTHEVETSATVIALRDRGWVLDAAGAPPFAVEGLRLQQAVEIDYADAEEPLTLAPLYPRGAAKFAVLWCNPPIKDPQIVDPQLTLTVEGEQIRVPCADGVGTPAVTSPAAVPMSKGRGQLVGTDWSGDLPTRGTAVIGFYLEIDGATGMPVTELTSSQAPPSGAAGSVILDERSPSSQGPAGRTYLQQLEVSHDSTITAWAGSSLAMTLRVDGTLLTDDGDLRLDAGLVLPEDLWRTQDAQLRQGRWVVDEPPSTRTFTLPEELRPAPGERRRVSVAVAVAGPRLPRWQVVVSQARASAPPSGVVPLRTSRHGTTDGGELPDFIGGYRFVGQWQVPADGMPHDLDPPRAPGLGKNLTYLALVDEVTLQRWPVQPAADGGTVESDIGLAALPVSSDLAQVLAREDLPAWTTRPSWSSHQPGSWVVTPPVLPGHPSVQLVAYRLVDFADYDHADAPVMPGSWPARHGWGAGNPGLRVIATGTMHLAGSEGGDDARGRPHSRSTVSFAGSGRATTLRVTTQGRGRLRVLIDGEPSAYFFPARDGWWTSWTDAAVVTDIPLGEVSTPGQLSLELDGYRSGFSATLLDCAERSPAGRCVPGTR